MCQGTVVDIGVSLGEAVSSCVWCDSVLCVRNLMVTLLCSLCELVGMGDVTFVHSRAVVRQVVMVVL